MKNDCKSRTFENVTDYKKPSFEMMIEECKKLLEQQKEMEKDKIIIARVGNTDQVIIIANNIHEREMAVLLKSIQTYKELDFQFGKIGGDK